MSIRGQKTKEITRVASEELPHVIQCRTMMTNTTYKQFKKSWVLSRKILTQKLHISTGIKCLKLQTEINVSSLENKQLIPTLSNSNFVYLLNYSP